MSVTSFILQENGCCNERFTGILCSVNLLDQFVITTYCRKGAQPLEYFTGSMGLLPFEIYFVGLSVTEEQLFSKSIVTGNSILLRMVCYLSCMCFRSV